MVSGGPGFAAGERRQSEEERVGGRLDQGEDGAIA